MAFEFLRACQAGNASEAQKWLDSNPPLLEVSDAKGMTGLIVACQNAHEEVIQLLLARGASTAPATKLGNSALFYASLIGRMSVIEALLAAGANVNATNINHDSPLLWAARQGHSHVVKLFLARGASLDQVNHVR